MNEPVHTVNITEVMTRHLIEVFQTMLAFKAVPLADLQVLHHHDRVSGSVGFAGETLNGVVYFHLSNSLAAAAAAAMLGLKPGEINGDAEVNDVVGEISNMLAGGLKSALCDNGAPCALSTPSIIRGTAFIVETIPDVERIWLPFQCEQHTLAVEIHIRYN